MTEFSLCFSRKNLLIGLCFSDDVLPWSNYEIVQDFDHNRVLHSQPSPRYVLQGKTLRVRRYPSLVKLLSNPRLQPQPSYPFMTEHSLCSLGKNFNGETIYFLFQKRSKPSKILTRKNCFTHHDRVFTVFVKKKLELMTIPLVKRSP